MAKRRCRATTIRGKPCRNPVTLETGYCIAHSPKETGESRGFGGSQPGAGRPRTPRVVDVMRERVEADIERILKPYFDAVDNAVMHATYEGEVHASDIPDLGARIQTAEKLLDRIYGRPAQVGERPGVSVDVNLNLVTDHELRERAADLRRRLAATRTVKPSRLDVGE